MRWARSAWRRLGYAIAALMLVAVGAAIGAGIAITTATSHDNTINACVNRYNGDVRITRTPGRCASTEYALDWERYSEEVTVGGVDNLVVSETFLIPGPSSNFLTVICADVDPSRPVATGGGYAGASVSEIGSSAPSINSAGQAEGWYVFYNNPSPLTDDIVVYAVCAPAAP